VWGSLRMSVGRAASNMFAIVISEKGGAERREAFDKLEIHVGRMQGNDLMLPKGNVSKRHARLMLRDGRVIVTDLKSTNGTYVNGRKIAQATVLGEGDRIYVGDFVLRVELPSASPTGEPPRPGVPDAAPTPRPVDGVPPYRAPFSSDSEFTSPQQEAVHFPPSDRAVSTPAGAISRPSASHIDSPRDTMAPPRAMGSMPSMNPSLVPRPTEAPPPDADTNRSTALRQVLEAVAATTDLAWLAAGSDPDKAAAESIEQAVRLQARKLRDQRLLPSDVELEPVIADALRELLGLGPIDLLLDDQDVTEIRVFGPRHVTAVKGDDVTVNGPSFSTEAALQHVICRLCQRSQKPLENGESVVERRLANGLVVHAVLAPASDHGPALIVKRQRRAQAGLEDLVRSGMISRAMATLFYGCVSLRTNMLLVGPAEGTAMLLSALVSAGQGHARAVVLQSDDDVWELEPSPVSLRMHDSGAEGAKLVRAAAKLRAERMVVTPMLGQVAAAVLAATGHGARGVLAVVPAPSVRHALQRLVGDLMMAMPGINGDAARAGVLGSFEMVVEVARLRDGRHRVTRFCELAAAEGELQPRDVFTFVVERTAAGGAIEGSFVPTGVVPKIVDDLALQGSAFDSAVFRRERA
jgi:pilus assembly protein CpaF